MVWLPFASLVGAPATNVTSSCPNHNVTDRMIDVVAEVTTFAESCVTELGGNVTAAAARWAVSLASNPPNDVIVEVVHPESTFVVPSCVFVPRHDNASYCSDPTLDAIRSGFDGLAFATMTDARYVANVSEYLQQRLLEECALERGGAEEAVGGPVLVSAEVTDFTLGWDFAHAIASSCSFLPAQFYFVAFEAPLHRVTFIIQPCAAAVTWDQTHKFLLGTSDTVAQGDRQIQISHRLHSFLPGCDLLTPPLQFAVVDDDEAGIHILSAPVSVAEAGGVEHVRITLASKPLAPVLVTVRSERQVIFSPLHGATVFSPANWSTAVDVPVRALDNDLDTLQTGVIRLYATSLDPAYNEMETAVPPIAIENDDVAGSTLFPTLLNCLEGGSGTLNVLLHAKPSNPVIVYIRLDDGGVEIALPIQNQTSFVHLQSCLTAIPDGYMAAAQISPEHWTASAVITLTIPDDDVDHGARRIGASVKLWSCDAAFNVNLGDVSLQLVEDDSAAVYLSTYSLGIREGGLSDYYIWLGSAPMQGVTIEPMVDWSVSEVDLNVTVLFHPAVVMFDEVSWRRPVRIQVSILDNTYAGSVPEIVASLFHKIASRDRIYNSTTPPNLTLAVLDDDRASISFNATAWMSEGDTDTDRQCRQMPTLVIAEGDSVAIAISLTTQPLADVFLSWQMSASLNSSTTAPLIFSPSAYNISQFLNITAMEDDLVRRQVGDIVLSIMTIDPVYSKYNGHTISVSIVDGDFSGVVLESSGIVQIEEGSNSTDICFRTKSRPRDRVEVLGASVVQTLGCLDTAAMNYDSRASQHDPTLCKLYHRISGECGSSILSSGDLVTIQLGNEYLHPVVFLGLTDRDLQARATRLSYRVNGCSGWCLTLSIRSRISASQSSSDNSKISLHWMVLESGVFRSDELMLLQVASTTLRPGLMGADLTISYGVPFMHTPVLIIELQPPLPFNFSLEPVAFEVASAGFQIAVTTNNGSQFSAVALGYFATEVLGKGTVGGVVFEATHSFDPRYRQPSQPFDSAYDHSLQQQPKLFGSASAGVNRPPLCMSTGVTGTPTRVEYCGSDDGLFENVDTAYASLVTLYGTGALLFVPGAESRCRIGLLRCECFASPDFSGQPVGVRCESRSALQQHTPPRACQSLDRLSVGSVRWQGDVLFEDGVYKFYVGSGRLYLNNREVVTGSWQRLSIALYNVRLDILSSNSSAAEWWTTNLSWEKQRNETQPSFFYQARSDPAAGAALYRDGQLLGLSDSGYNVAVLNQYTGDLDAFGTFDVDDLHAAFAFHIFLSAIPTGRVVLVATQNSSSLTSEHLAAVDLRNHFCAPAGLVNRKAGSFAMVSCKLCCAPANSFVGHRLVPVEQGIAEISVRVPLSTRWPDEDVIRAATGSPPEVVQLSSSRTQGELCFVASAAQNLIHHPPMYGMVQVEVSVLPCPCPWP